MAKLAQTSIQFRDFKIDEKRLNQLGIKTDSIAEKVAREIYGKGVEVDVVLEAGSLLIRITVIGTLAWGGYDTVSKYPDFKAGISELVKDAQNFGSIVYSQVLKLTGEEKADSVTKRNMTPGKIARMIQKLEKLEDLHRRAPSRVIRKELQEIAREVRAIERDLQPKERRLVGELLELTGLPPLDQLPKSDPDYDEDRIAILTEREERRLKAPSAHEAKKKPLRYHNRFVV